MLKQRNEGKGNIYIFTLSTVGCTRGAVETNKPIAGAAAAMFGATAVRAKRERERREKLARGGEPTVYPYIAPFPPCFQPEEVPYFKYRRALEECKEKGRVLVFFKNCRRMGFV